jgi:type II secretory pathway component PulM
MSKKAIVIAMGIVLVLLFVFAGFVTPSIRRTI